MSKKSERAMDIAVKAILFMIEDEGVGIMWKNMEEKERVLVKNKIATYASSQLEEYAGSLPIEPANKVVLMYPDWIYDKDLYLKDRKSGTLTPVKLVKKEQEDAEQSTPESTMQ